MGRLTAIVLGSAGGGGFPQWNCRCPVCQLAWAGDTRVKLRTAGAKSMLVRELTSRDSQLKAALGDQWADYKTAVNAFVLGAYAAII